MIKLSNGMKHRSLRAAALFVDDLRKCREWLANQHSIGERGFDYAISTAIAAIDAAIENAELALKSAQRKEDKMKAVKKSVKPAAKKPAVKKAAAKKSVAKKK